MPQQRCPYCGKEFEPKPHLIGTQTCCGDKNCKAKRKREAHARWLIANPDYFKGRYARTQMWLAHHPGYQSRYRAENPDYVRRDNAGRRRRRIRAVRRADIQDAWPRREIRRIQEVQGADIQDTCQLRLDELLCALGGRPAPIYKPLSTSTGVLG